MVRTIQWCVLFGLITTINGNVSVAQEAGRGQVPLGGPLPERVYRQVHALCIGINEYRSVGIPELKWAEKDAKAMAELFEAHYGYQVNPLYGRNATRRKILQAIDQYDEQLQADDALVIYFAGHGETVELDAYGRAGFLVPFDAQVDLGDTLDTREWEEAAISMHLLGEKVKAMKARHVLLIADACYSGFLGKRSGLGGRVDLQQLVRRKSRMAITAGTEVQSAIEYPELQHGVFTYFLLQQLRSSSPSSANEVHVSVRRAVSNHTGGRMLPQSRDIVVDNGEFVFLPKEIPDDEVADVIDDVNARINRRVARKTTLEHLIEAYEAPNYRFAADFADLERVWKLKLKRFENNAFLGDPLAMAALHYCYAKGLGSAADEQKAHVWARRAYDSQAAVGIHVLARCYLNGIGVNKNEVAAWKMLEKAAEAGFPISQLTVAARELERETELDEKAGRQVVRWLEESGEAGIKQANVMLARVYAGRSRLNGVEVDRGRAIKIAEAAAEAGSHDAGHLLVRLHLTSSPPDTKTARKWLERGAHAGHGLSQFWLAAAYLQKPGFDDVKVGLKQDVREAVRWAQLAAEQGIAGADFMLAILYSEGENGVDRNLNQAREHMQEAVAAEYPDALAAQGVWYFQGTVYKRDEKKAAQLFRAASDAGSGMGAYWLAICYDLAQGINPNGLQQWQLKPDAIHWFIKSYQMGYEPAEKALVEDMRKFLFREFNLPILAILEKEYPATAVAYYELLEKHGEKPEKWLIRGTETIDQIRERAKKSG